MEGHGTSDASEKKEGFSLPSRPCLTWMLMGPGRVLVGPGWVLMSPPWVLTGPPWLLIG